MGEHAGAVGTTIVTVPSEPTIAVVEPIIAICHSDASSRSGWTDRTGGPLTPDMSSTARS